MTKEMKETKPAVRQRGQVRPWRLMDIEKAFEPMFNDSWFGPFRRPWRDFWRPEEFSLEAPAIDVYEDKDDLIVKAEMPGLNKDEIDVSVTGNTLTVKGEKKKEEEINEKDYYRCERAFGSFSRTVELPVAVKTDDIKASFKNGVLEIRLPKTEEAKKNVVHVKVA
jgi:HSP20 family protein